MMHARDRRLAGAELVTTIGIAKSPGFREKAVLKITTGPAWAHFIGVVQKVSLGENFFFAGTAGTFRRN